MPSKKRKDIHPQNPEQLYEFARKYPGDFINHCLSQPQWKKLSEARDDNDSSLLSRCMSILKKHSFALFLARPSGFIGRGFVSEEVKSSSVKLATSVSITTGLNVFGVWPLLLYAFGTLPFGGVASVGFGAFLLKLMNIAGESAAANNPRARKLAQGWLMLFLALNIFTTIAGGVGSLLLLGQKQLSEAHADEIVATRVMPDFKVRLSEAKALWVAQKAFQQKCDEGERELLSLPEGSVARGDKFRQLYGEYGSIWEGEPETILPDCPLAKHRGSQATEAQAQAQSDLAQARQDHSRLQSEPFLKEEYPKLHGSEFTASGALKDKDKAVSLAMELFFERMARVNISGLGSSGVVFILSIITSMASIWLIKLHSCRSDVQRSHILEISKIRRNFFNDVRKGIRQIPTTPAE